MKKDHHVRVAND